MTDEEFLESVGNLARNARLRANLSQRAVSELTKITEANLSRIESGKCLPSLRTLNRLAEVYGVDVPTLLPAVTRPAKGIRP